MISYDPNEPQCSKQTVLAPNKLFLIFKKISKPNFIFLSTNLSSFHCPEPGSCHLLQVFSSNFVPILCGCEYFYECLQVKAHVCFCHFTGVLWGLNEILSRTLRNFRWVWFCKYVCACINACLQQGLTVPSLSSSCSPGSSTRLQTLPAHSAELVLVTLHQTRGLHIVPRLGVLPAMSTHSQHTNWL